MGLAAAEFSSLDTQIIDAILMDVIRSPSGDNSQHWKFHWDGDELWVLYSHELGEHCLNVDQQIAMLTLGTVIESVRLSASKHGLAIQVHLLFEKQMPLSRWARIKFSSANVPTDPLVQFIDLRSTDRSIYRAGALPETLLKQIQNIASEFPGFSVRVQNILSPKFYSYFYKTEKDFWQNTGVVRDLSKWLRLKPQEVENHRDGMSAQNVGLKPFEALAFRCFRQWPALPKLLWHLGFGLTIRKRAKESLQSASAVLCFSAPSTEPEFLCKTGELAFRIWLLLNGAGFAVQPLSHASLSVPMNKNKRTDKSMLFTQGEKILRQEFQLNENENPIWMLRTGLSSQSKTVAVTPRKELRDFVSEKI